VNELYLNVYHRLPAQLRNIAAGMRGYYLRSWRYGADSAELTLQALERERWTREQWDHYVQQRLRYVLHRAATQVPYYKQYWAERRRGGDRRLWEHLENWPVLD